MKIKLRNLTLGLENRICNEICTCPSCPLLFVCSVRRGGASPAMLGIDLNQEIELPKMEFVRGYFTCNGKIKGYWRTRQ